MLDDLAGTTIVEPYSIAPTQFEEATLGYDIKVRSQKVVFFQFKRVQYTRGGMQVKVYKIPPGQLLALQGNAAGPGRAFYALPQIETENEMQLALLGGNYLGVMTFVDAYVLQGGVSRFSFDTRGGTWDAEGRLAPYAITTYNWARIRAGLEDCTLGIQLWERTAEAELAITAAGRAFLGRRSLMDGLSERFVALQGTAQVAEAAPVLDELASRLLEIAAFSQDSDQWSPAKSALVELLQSELRERVNVSFKDWNLDRGQLLRLPMV